MSTYGEMHNEDGAVATKLQEEVEVSDLFQSWNLAQNVMGQIKLHSAPPL